MKVNLGPEARARLLQHTREEQRRILVALTAEVKGGTMTSEKALVIVSELSTLQGFINKIDKEVLEVQRRS